MKWQVFYKCFISEEMLELGGYLYIKKKCSSYSLWKARLQSLPQGRGSSLELLPQDILGQISGFGRVDTTW